MLRNNSRLRASLPVRTPPARILYRLVRTFTSVGLLNLSSTDRGLHYHAAISLLHRLAPLDTTESRDHLVTPFPDDHVTAH